jgi:hypothetical protein
MTHIPGCTPGVPCEYSWDCTCECHLPANAINVDLINAALDEVVERERNALANWYRTHLHEEHGYSIVNTLSMSDPKLAHEYDHQHEPFDHTHDIDRWIPLPYEPAVAELEAGPQ